MGNPTVYANYGEYGMNRLVKSIFNNYVGLCDGHNTGAIYTTAESEGRTLYYALFNMSSGSYLWSNGEVKKIYYDGKNMTKLRMLSVSYNPAFIWLNDHCTIQYLQCQDLCCDNMSNVVDLTTNLCNEYVPSSIRFQILDFEPTYPTLLISYVFYFYFLIIL